VPIDLASGLLLRATLLRLDAVRHVLLLNLHHIAADLWSLGILANELAALYPAFATAGTSKRTLAGEWPLKSRTSSNGIPC
jgi:hypothetical protein